MVTKRGFNTRIIVVFVVLSLMVQLFSSMSAHAAPNVSIDLSNNVKVSLFDAQLAATENGQVASFTLKIDNKSNSSVNLLDYWARIKGTEGKKYITKLVTSDVKKPTVPANNSTYLTFYAQVDKSATISTLSIDFLKWDFSRPNYESVVGNLKPGNNGTITLGQTQNSRLNQNLLGISLKKYTMYEDSKYAYVNMELNITNSSSLLLKLDDLQYQVTTNSKQILSGTAGYKDLSLKAFETKPVTVGVAIPRDKWDNNMTLQVLGSEGGESNILLPLANIVLTKLKSTAALPVNKPNTLNINGNSLTIEAGESSVSELEGKTEMTSAVTVVNNEPNAITLPSLSFYVKTKEGLLYPLQIEKTEDVTFLPKMKQELKLIGQIPNKQVLGTSQLVYFLKNEETNIKSFLGNFAIKLSNGDQEENTSNASKEKIYNGLKIEQLSIQRTPNNLNDLIVAEFKVTNTSKVAKPILNIEGNFVLDKVQLKENSKIKSLDSTLVLAPGQSYRFIAFTTIPYTQVVKNYGFKMTEVTADSKKNSIHTFSVDNIYNARLLAENEEYQIETVGKRGSVKFLNSSLYESSSTNLVYAELEYVNNEQRANAVTSLNGYLRNKKGDIIDLKFESYEHPILPSDQLIMATYATLPRNFSMEGLEIFFGEAVTVAEGITAAVSPVYTDNVKLTAEPKNNFVSIPIQQYQLSIRDIGAYIMSSDSFAADTIELQFEYDLLLNEGAPNYTTDHTILVEFDDMSNPRFKFSQEFKLGELESKDDNLVLGKGLDKTFRYKNNSIGSKQFGTFQLNIYDVYKGHKKLIARRTLDMGTINK